MAIPEPDRRIIGWKEEIRFRKSCKEVRDLVPGHKDREKEDLSRAEWPVSGS